MYFLKKRKIKINTHSLSFSAKLFMIILLVTVFEGAARKWLETDTTYALILLRDSTAAYGVLWGLVKKKLYKSKYFTVLLLFSFILLMWGYIQIYLNRNSPIVFILGIRFWLLYLWFAFFVGKSLTSYDFEIIIKTFTILVTGMVPLVLIQHFSLPTSFINKQVGEGYVFIVAQGVVRVTSTFSFTTGYTTFLAMATPFIFISFNKGYNLWRNNWMGSVGLISLLISIIVSGSRGAIVFSSTFIIINTLLVLFFSKGKAKLNAIYLIFGVILFLLISSLVFNRAINATQHRFIDANESEDLIDRLIYMFIGNTEVTLLGKGVGMGTNISSFIQRGYRSFLLAESETARIILEIGLLGIIVIFIKITIIVYSLNKSYLIAKIYKDFSAILLWVTLALAILSWPITGQLTINSLGYLLLGVGFFVIKKEQYKCS